jgi:multiple sugar transport system permease protein
MFTVQQDQPLHTRNGQIVAFYAVLTGLGLVVGVLAGLGFASGMIGRGLGLGLGAGLIMLAWLIFNQSLTGLPWRQAWGAWTLGALALGTLAGTVTGGWGVSLPGLAASLSIAWLLRRARELPRQIEANLWGWVLLMPAMLLLVAWHFAPAVFAFVQSFFDNLNFVTPAQFSGLENYAILLRDPLFWKSLLNTFWYVILTVPVSILIATLLAILLNENVRGQVMFRTIYFLPYITALTAAAAVWKWIYNPEYGLLNALLGTQGQQWLDNPTGVLALLVRPLGLELPGVLSGPSVALLCVMAMSIWHHLGYAVVILLAGLQSVPREYYEAASLDGASWWDQVRHITWPLLTPTTFFLAITGLIGSFQVFTQILVLTPGGGVLNDTLTIVKYLYDKGFRDNQYSYASAMAFALFAIVFAATLVQNRVLSRRVNYEL